MAQILVRGLTSKEPAPTTAKSTGNIFLSLEMGWKGGWGVKVGNVGGRWWDWKVRMDGPYNTCT